MTIEVDDRIAGLMRRLQAQAMQRGLSFGAYLEQIVEAQPAAPTNGNCSLAEFDSVLDELASMTIDGPSLPADFSRSDIYADHD